jgi:DnaJ-class molecular chaperone
MTVTNSQEQWTEEKCKTCEGEGRKPNLDVCNDCGGTGVILTKKQRKGQ